MLKIRIEGLPEEIDKFMEPFRKKHNVLMESKTYKNRNSKYVRLYVEIEED